MPPTCSQQIIRHKLELTDSYLARPHWRLLIKIMVKFPLYQTHGIWLGTKFSQPNPKLGFCKPRFKPNSIYWQKSEVLQWEKCWYKAPIEKMFLTLYNIFIQTPKNDLRLIKNNFFQWYSVLGLNRYFPALIASCSFMPTSPYL